MTKEEMTREGILSTIHHSIEQQGVCHMSCKLLCPAFLQPGEILADVLRPLCIEHGWYWSVTADDQFVVFKSNPSLLSHLEPAQLTLEEEDET